MTEQTAERIAEALERIAVALERFEPAEEPACEHPQAERELMPGSTMIHARHRCKACGAEDV